jgi:hypothetical protein
LQERRPSLGEHRVPIVNEVTGVAKKSVLRIEQIARRLLHPVPVRGDADPCDPHRMGLHVHDEEDHVANRPEHAQDLDAEKVASVQGLPVALEKLPPGSLAAARRRRLDPGLPSMFATVVRPISILSGASPNS